MNVMLPSDVRSIKHLNISEVIKDIDTRSVEVIAS